MAKPSQNSQLLKSGLISPGESPSSIMEIGSCVMGKIRRSWWTHCLRRMTMMAIMPRCRERASGSQWSRGGSHSPQGTPPPGAPS